MNKLNELGLFIQHGDFPTYQQTNLAMTVKLYLFMFLFARPDFEEGTATDPYQDEDGLKLHPPRTVEERNAEFAHANKWLETSATDYSHTE